MTTRSWSAVAVIAVAVASLPVSVPIAVPVTSAAAAPVVAAKHVNRSSPVTLTVQDVTPSVPRATTAYSALTITATLENTTSTALTGVAVTVERGSPIGNQSAFDHELARAGTPVSGGLAVKPTRAVTTDLPADDDPVQVRFRTTTSLLNEGRGICLCANAVYPLQVQAAMTGSDGSAEVLGTTTTYLPSFDVKTVPVKVAWVWPLIDRPHRLAATTFFTDDDLADSVDTGRLSRALAVIEEVDARRTSSIPITLMVDPDLLDELEVMATRTYRYRTASGTFVVGQGRSAAQSWLARFDDVVHEPGIQVALTPYADPDVQSLTSAGLGWASVLPDDMSKRVTTALGGVLPVTDVAWPASTRIDRSTLDTLRASGSDTVILGSKAVNPRCGRRWAARLGRPTEVHQRGDVDRAHDLDDAGLRPLGDVRGR